MSSFTLPASDSYTGALRRSPHRCRRHTLVTYERDHPRRTTVEDFVRHAFALKHGARIRSFMPTLFALEGSEQRVCGVAGIRSADAEPLFLERYLPRPIELVLSDRTGAPVKREQIVEVGNLASLSCRAAFHLVALLPRLLNERGHLWVTFTATDVVRDILGQFKAPIMDLSSATADKVAGLGDDWGRYYESDPRVMAAWLPHGLAFSFAHEAL